MPIEFRRVLTPGIAQLSYLVGDSGAGVAAVVDPRPDCDVYLCHARELGVAITHILETHIHADFMSGARELADRLGHARVYLSREGDAHYGFEHKPIGDGDVVELGKLRLTARATPGHTPEHLAFELANEDSAASPWGVLTGDSLFVNSVGRPDLMGDDETDALARRLFETMQGYYKQLDPGVIIYPAHGHGSECGPKIADRLDSSIGYELAHNPYLKTDSLAAFRRRLNADAPPEPTHYRRLKTVNAQGPPILGAGPAIPPLTPKHFREAMGSGTTLVIDTRHMLAFGGGHIAGARSTWAFRRS
jgi:hydroxyacylglutathione hydrolase